MKLIGNNIKSTIKVLKNHNYIPEEYRKKKKSTSAKKDKTIVILKILLSFILLVAGVILLYRDKNSQLGTTLVSISVGYWLG